MSELIKKSLCSVGRLLLLWMSCAICHISYASTVRCAPDSNISNSVTAFDFNKLPNQIPKTVPTGTTI